MPPEECACCIPPIQGLFERPNRRSKRKFVAEHVAPSMGALPISWVVGTDDQPPGGAPDRIFVGATVRTMNPAQPVAEAFAVKGGRLVGVGSRGDMLALQGPGTRVIDAEGATILPGFIDPHVHVIMGAQLSSFIDVRAIVCETVEEVMASLAAGARAAAPGSWVMARGFDPSLTRGNAEISRHELDVVAPHNPVFMLNASGHLAYVNSKAIELAGVSEATADPGAGGRYIKDAQGKLTGVLAGGSSYAPFLRLAPRLSPGELSGIAIRELDKAAAAGCTMLVDCGLGGFAGTDELSILRMLSGSGRSPVRLAAMLSSARIDQWMSHPDVAPGAGDDWLRLLGFKFWADGSNQGNTGFQREPYLNVDSRGILSLSPDELRGGISRAHKAGWQVAVHANGDAAIDIVLDAYEQVLTASPRDDHRHRIEHCSIAWDEQFHRMSKLGLTPSFLIGHVHYWGRVFRDRIFGPAKAARLDATASALRAGVRFTLHSDYDVTEIAPLRCIANAVTRTMRDGGEILAPDERISVDQALRSMTIDAAWQARMEHAVGSLEPGKYADFVVLGEDPMTADPEQLAGIKVRETWVEGIKRFG